MSRSLQLRACVVIPARMASTRLPHKMLLAETGKALIAHTYENACRARLPIGVVVATDHPAIAEVIEHLGGRAVMTSEACASGTDRVAEVADAVPEADILVNVQGDEPELDPAAIDGLIDSLSTDHQSVMATLATPIRQREQLESPACVKVVMDNGGRALYFSRSPIPFVRDAEELPLAANPPLFHQHIGVYAYRREFLLELARQRPTSLEEAEKLEQLRVLQMGHSIQVRVVERASIGIDTAEDYARFVARYRRAA
jgi:3-deoxy-manno-octulosonate cytidylyltransferase (CMP-KDO synthetase)